MADKKMNPMDALKSHDCDLRNAAMVYLHEINDVSFDFLSDVTGLALSTVKNYVLYKFHHLLDYAKKLFTKAKNTIRKVSARGYFCYIDKITLRDGRIWCKIGQSTRDPEKRAQEIKSKGWRGGTIIPTKVEVMEVIECKDETSMTNMEDCLRLGMTAINPEKYEKNDRLLEWEDDYPQRILTNPFVKMGIEQFTITA